MESWNFHPISTSYRDGKNRITIDIVNRSSNLLIDLLIDLISKTSSTEYTWIARHALLNYSNNILTFNVYLLSRKIIPIAFKISYTIWVMCSQGKYIECEHSIRFEHSCRCCRHAHFSTRRSPVGASKAETEAEAWNNLFYFILYIPSKQVPSNFRARCLCKSNIYKKHSRLACATCSATSNAANSTHIQTF